jgi:hypothetical protein
MEQTERYTTTDNPSLEVLAGQLAEAKIDESAAKQKRIEIEEKIAEQVETADNGSKTVDAGNGMKVTVKRELGYTADVEAIRALPIPEEVMPLKLTDPKPATFVFDKKAYENVVENHPDVAARLADCVTVKPRKVNVTLKIG